MEASVALIIPGTGHGGREALRHGGVVGGRRAHPRTRAAVTL
jgi:hypothetical protein